MTKELYIKLLKSVTEFNYLSVSNIFEKGDTVILHVPNMGLYASVQKSNIESRLKSYTGKTIKIFNSLKNFNDSVNELR
jgi:hypothetical protein